MLKDKDSAAIVAVTDIERSRRFYGETLGLETVDGGGEVTEYRTGRTSLVIYRSEFAGTNKANAVVWGVGDEMAEIVATLSARGVQFEHYVEMGLDYANGIHTDGAFQMAWFKDPDGNILHLNNM